jgi:hypothetical protein
MEGDCAKFYRQALETAKTELSNCHARRKDLVAEMDNIFETDSAGTHAELMG